VGQGRHDPPELAGETYPWHYDFIALPDTEVPQAVDSTFQHVVTTYASEANKTVSVWRAVPNDLLDFKPHDNEPHPHYLGLADSCQTRDTW
jgi:hypothetical protein